MSAPRQALVGAGANLGDRPGTLKAALSELAAIPGIHTVTASSIYETDPVGVLDQPLFLNLVAGIETALSPEALLHVLQETEQAHGRVRHERWGPRTLDLDLLAYEGETRATARLQLPHPRMLTRGFVMVPLAELLATPAFQRSCWDALRASVSAAPYAAGVRLFR